MKEEWLFHGAVVPIDVETTAALVAEIKRLIDVIGGMALAQPEQEPVAWMSEDERESFERFNETCEDGEGYDVPKTMMRRLAEIGVIHHTSRGIYGITKFGRLLVGNTTPPQRTWVGLTNDEVNNFAAGCHLGKSVQGAIYEAEAKLKDKNNG